MEKQPHILVVDDHAEIRSLVQRYLGDHGYRVSTAANGVEMHRVLAAAAIELVVLDLMMPGEDGLTLCRNLRAGPHGVLPVIVVPHPDPQTTGSFRRKYSTGDVVFR